MQLRVDSVSRKPSMVSTRSAPLGGVIAGTMLRSAKGTAVWQSANGKVSSQKRQTATPWAGARSAAWIGSPQSGQ